MPQQAVFTLILATLIIAAAALGLSRVIMHLRAVVKSLDALEGGVASNRCKDSNCSIGCYIRKRQPQASA